MDIEYDRETRRLTVSLTRDEGVTILAGEAITQSFSVTGNEMEITAQSFGNTEENFDGKYPVGHERHQNTWLRRPLTTVSRNSVDLKLSRSVIASNRWASDISSGRHFITEESRNAAIHDLRVVYPELTDGDTIAGFDSDSVQE